MKQISLLTLFLMVSSFCVAQTYQPNTPKPREMKLSYRNGQDYIGDIPFIMSTYDATGKPVGGLSADFKNTLMDISDLPQQYPWTLLLGIQFGREETKAAIVGLGRKMCSSIFIDSNGLIFPDNIRQVDEMGPSVTVQLNSPDGKNIMFKDFVVQVKTISGKSLKTRHLEGDMLIIENVPREPLDITITQSDTSLFSRSIRSAVLFPAFRSAKAGLVIYTLNFDYTSIKYITKSFLNKLPTPGKIISVQTDSLISVTTVTLSNGVKVILKPTEFKSDQILINGYKFGGTSLASDQDYTSATLAAEIIDNSGIAGFSQAQLDKMLSGENVSVGPYISDIAVGISANSTTKDFETAMQLIYMYFTKPRKDADIWRSIINQQKSLLVNRSLDPGSIFRDTVSAILSNHNFRGMVTTPELLNSASLDKAYTFYKDRFADASGFTFTFVGNFTVDVIKPYLEAYLGSLPSENKKEMFKNLNINPPSGVITKTIYKGIGDKAIVELVSIGDFEYKDANNMQLDALESILQLKLYQRWRKKEGEVYLPKVTAKHKKIPDGTYSFTIYFECTPTNVDQLIDATMDEINKIRQNGALPVDIQKFAMQEARTTQLQLKENIFWAGYLGATSQNQEDPDAILNHVNSLGNVTVQSTKDAANKYLSGNNLIKLILLPEKK